MNMKITIAIPAYKANFLKEAIESVVQQSYNDWELVIVNDHSPHDLTSIVEPFLCDDRIKYFINSKNCGAINVVDNWNLCLQHTTGDYIMLIGDDDKLPRDSLKNYVQIIENYPNCNVYHGRTILIDEDSQPIYIQEARPACESLSSAIWHRIDGRQQFIGDFLFNTHCLRERGGFFKLPLAWGSDDLSVFYSINEEGIGNCNEPCFCYRVNRYSITSSGSSDIKLSTTFLHQLYLTKLLTSYQAEGTDELLRKLSIDRLDNYFIKKRINIISVDIASNGKFQIIKWLFKKTELKLSYKHIIYAIVESFKFKYSRM